ncbi:hypothetical protein [Azoarcus taiwanensis]|uniref:Phosphonate ABC transporter, permease protein PhnE n=1 Tax=Azoarcus taiwanensis TaxID=666964 RepID=A0A972FMK4_9RHOO|nr:hypothetical protein [Azoarcus taiwanensis]NMG05011.1 hypothetical protein [Azoarcus taiwanensis]
MTAASATAPSPTVADRLPAIERLFARKRLFSFGVPGVILAYLLYVFFAFDVPGLIQRANMDNARILVADSYSHKTHVTQDTRSGQIRVAIEGEAKGVYPEHLLPDWVAIDGPSAEIDLGRGQSARIDNGAVFLTVPGYGVIEARSTRNGVSVNIPDGPNRPTVKRVGRES